MMRDRFLNLQKFHAVNDISKNSVKSALEMLKTIYVKTQKKLRKIFYTQSKNKGNFACMQKYYPQMDKLENNAKTQNSPQKLLFGQIILSRLKDNAKSAFGLANAREWIPACAGMTKQANVISDTYTVKKQIKPTFWLYAARFLITDKK